MPDALESPTSSSSLHFGPPDDPERYQLGPQIGAGATAKVHKCKRVEDGRLFAVKVTFSSQVARDPDRSEIAILERLAHRNIVKLYDVISKGTMVYMVIEYVGGGELLSFIAADPRFGQQLVVKFIFCQIVDALIYLHSNGVIHRDLKPENILIASLGMRGEEEKEEDPGPPPPEGYPTVPGIRIYPIVKLADFGLSRVVSVFGRASTVVGTPQYWAPEVVRSRETGEGYDGRADNWSLGVLLYVMLAKRYPFRPHKRKGVSMKDRINGGQEISFEGMDRVDAAAKDLISRLIVVNPAERISLGEALHHPWLKDFPLASQVASARSSGLIEVASTASSSGGGEVQERSSRGGLDEGSGEVAVEAEEESVRELREAEESTVSGERAAERLRLDELCEAQVSLLDLLEQVCGLLQDDPAIESLVHTFIIDAAELRRSTMAFMCRCADVAQVVEKDISDMTLFVEEGMPDCAVDCMDSVKSKLIGMGETCESLQRDHADFGAKVEKIIVRLPGAAETLTARQREVIRYYQQPGHEASPEDESGRQLAALLHPGEGDLDSKAADIFDLSFLAGS
ncbi:hypothetical protein FOZ62_022966, partial [Perkinsus olseni]